jgi:hypothetical protein
LNGEVPETLVTGQTPDISQFCELEWYEWIKFYDSEAPFPDDKMVTGRYLGPSLDVGPAMTAKILKQNGERIHRSTYRALTDDEINDPVEQQERAEFDASIKEKLGPEAKPDDFSVDVDVETVTPHLDRYEDGETKPHIIPDRDEEDNFDVYIGAEVLLPFQGTEQTG